MNGCNHCQATIQPTHPNFNIDPVFFLDLYTKSVILST